MWKDPIVEEVRKIREEILAECGGDHEKLAEKLRAQWRDYQDRLVTPESLKLRRLASRENPRKRDGA